MGDEFAWTIGAVGFGFGAALVFINLSALLLIAAYRRGHRFGGIGGLVLLHWGLHSQFLLWVGATTVEYMVGSAQLALETPGNPDPDTRLEQTTFSGPWCCICDSRWDTWSNGTLGALTWAFGPSPGGYNGAYPNGEEALKLLRTMGEAPMVVEGSTMVFSAGQRYPINPFTLGSIELYKQAGWPLPDRPNEQSLSARDIEQGHIESAVPLGPDSVLVQEKDLVSLRAWLHGDRGRIWATWPRTHE